MDDLTADAWADGLALYEDRWAFTAVAPRDHVEWWFDVAAVMRGETADPRGWASLDPYEEDVDREVETFAWIEPPPVQRTWNASIPPSKNSPGPRSNHSWSFSQSSA